MRAWLLLTVVACSPDLEPTEVDGWSWCPSTSPDRVSGRTWSIAEQTTYCATFSRSRILEEEGPAKAVLAFPAIDIAVPEDGSTEAELIACVEEDPGQPGLVPDGPASFSTRESGDNWATTATLPMRGPDDALWRLTLTTRWPGTSRTVDIDGGHLPFTGDARVDIELCPEPCQANARRFDSCHFDGVALERHRVVFDGGEISLDVRISPALFDTQPGLLVSASGMLDDRSFLQSSYWDLLYNPTLHHISRDARIVLPDPIGDVDSISVLDFDPFLADPPTQVLLHDGQGEVLRQASVIDESSERQLP